MGHGWASDVMLSNIHECSSLTSRFLLYKNTKFSIKNTIMIYLSPTSKLGYLSFKRTLLYASTSTKVHFKRLGSRHIHKEIEIPYCVFGFNEIICKTGLKHIQTLTHKCNIMKEKHFEAI